MSEKQLNTYYKVPYIFFRVILDAENQEVANERIKPFLSIIGKYGKFISIEKEAYYKYEESFVFSFVFEDLNKSMQIFLELLEELGSHWTTKRIEPHNEIYQAIWKRDWENSELNSFFSKTSIEWCFIELIEE